MPKSSPRLESSDECPKSPEEGIQYRGTSPYPMFVKELGLLIKAQYDRIHHTSHLLNACESAEEEEELRLDLRKHCLARDVLSEIFETYLDQLDGQSSETPQSL
jgi:hypothetical protein